MHSLKVIEGEIGHWEEIIDRAEASNSAAILQKKKKHPNHLNRSNTQTG